jgi:hypothetical protein
MRKIIIVLAFISYLVTGCATAPRPVYRTHIGRDASGLPVTVVSDTEAEATSQTQPGFLELETSSRDELMILVCHDADSCIPFGIFRAGQLSRIDWRPGSYVIVGYAHTRAQTPDERGRIHDVGICTPEEFSGTIIVTLGRNTEEHRFRHSETRSDGCLHHYILRE